MENLVAVILILIVLELFEAWWQKADTMLDVLARGYHYYRISIFLFFLMHLTFYYILFIILFTKVFNGWMVTILLLKSIDIFFKLAMIKKVFVEQAADDVIGPILTQPLSPWLFLTGVSLYPFLLFYALT